MATVTQSQLVNAGVSPSYAPALAKSINSLDPSIQSRYANTAIQFYQTYGNQGYDLSINQAHRTPAQQNAIRATGVKAASPRNTWHTAGGAADFTVFKDGKADKGTTYKNAYETLLAPIAKANGLHNPIRNDVGHFQPVEFPKARGGRAVADFITATQAKALAAADVPMPRLRPTVQTASLQDRPYYPVDPTAYRRVSAFAPEGQQNTTPFDALLAGPPPATGSKAASGLQGYLPGSQVSTPNLRPKAAPVASQVARTGPVPPLPIPEAPRSPMAVQPGPLGADKVVKAAMSGDAKGIKAAWAEILTSPEIFARGAEVQSYFADIGKSNPLAAYRVATNMAQSPALWQSVPEKATIFGPEVRAPIQSATQEVLRQGRDPASQMFAAHVPQYRSMTPSGPRPTASAASPSSSTPSPATGARAASGLQGYAKPASLPIATAGFTAPRPLNPAQAAKAPPPKPTTQQVLNPAWTQWSSALAANPMGWMGTPPPKYITKTVQAPAIAYAPTVAAKPASVKNAGLLGVTPPSSGGGSSSSSSASPYYSSSVSQGPTTVGRNSSGQTSYVSGPSGSFTVDKAAGTYTSLQNGKTFRL